MQQDCEVTGALVYLPLKVEQLRTVAVRVCRARQQSWHERCETAQMTRPCGKRLGKSNGILITKEHKDA
jgi:hypothetical protein